MIGPSQSRYVGIRIDDLAIHDLLLIKVDLKNGSVFIWKDKDVSGTHVIVDDFLRLSPVWVE